MPKAIETGWLKFEQNSFTVELENRIWGDTDSNTLQIYADGNDPVKLHCGHTGHQMPQLATMTPATQHTGP